MSVRPRPSAPSRARNHRCLPSRIGLPRLISRHGPLMPNERFIRARHSRRTPTSSANRMRTSSFATRLRARSGSTTCEKSRSRSAHVNWVPAEWHVAGVADFNGDGTADILLRNVNTGVLWMYLMNRETISVGGYVNTISSYWHVAAIRRLRRRRQSGNPLRSEHRPPRMVGRGFGPAESTNGSVILIQRGAAASSVRTSGITREYGRRQTRVHWRHEGAILEQTYVDGGARGRHPDVRPR